MGLAVHRSCHDTTKHLSGCAICKQVLPTIWDVLIHSCINNGILPKESAKCYEVLHTTWGVLSHSCINNGILPKESAKCYEVLHTTWGVLSHSCINNEILPKESAKCYEVLLTRLDVKFHERTTNGHNYDGNRFICGVCRDFYPTQRQLLGHLGLHTCEMTVTCTLYRVGFSVDSLEKHACFGPVRKN